MVFPSNITFLPLVLLNLHDRVQLWWYYYKILNCAHKTSCICSFSLSWSENIISPSQENRLQVAPILSVELKYFLKIMGVRSFTLTSQFGELLWVGKGLLERVFVVVLLVFYLFDCYLRALVVNKTKWEPQTKQRNPNQTPPNLLE